MPELAPGVEFAGHRIEGVAGRGGMGVVYRATHLALDHVVALKVISPELAGDERFRERFKSESRIAVSIRHPNVVAVHHAGEEDGLLFVTMDFVEGTDVRGLLNRRDRLDAPHALRIVAPVAGALDAAHARGLVHRDIKPGNVLIEERGDGEQVYLTDFGLTKRVEASTGVTATGAFVGTLDYVAPEQIRGERVDARTDVYALGCVLYEMLAGSAPFARQEEKVAKIYAHLQEDPAPLEDMAPAAPRALARVVTRAIEKDPERRYPSAGDLARAGEAALAGEAVTDPERSVATGAAAPVATRPFDVLGETATATAGAASGQAVTRREGPGPESAATAEPTREPPRRRGPLLLGLAAVAAAAAAAFLLGGDDSADEGSGGPGPRGSVRATAGAPVPTGDRPVGVKVLGGSVLVANRDGDTLSVIDAGSREPARDPLGVGAAPEAVDGADVNIWVVNGAGGSVSQFRADDLSPVRAAIAVGPDPRDVAVGDHAIWVTNGGGDSISRITPSTGAVRTVAGVGDEPHGVAVDDGTPWVVNRGDATLVAIDPGDGSVGEPIEVGANPKGIAAAAGRAWVANTGDGTVSLVDLGAGRETDVIEVGGEPRDVALEGGSAWVSNGDGYVTRIEADTAEVMGEVRVNGSPEGIAAAAGGVWVAIGDRDEVVPIELR